MKPNNQLVNGGFPLRFTLRFTAIKLRADTPVFPLQPPRILWL
jgi:hypothetical protein